MQQAADELRALGVSLALLQLVVLMQGVVGRAGRRAGTCWGIVRHARGAAQGAATLTWNRDARSWNPSSLRLITLKNRLICMDATNVGQFAQLLGRQVVQSDPVTLEGENNCTDGPSLPVALAHTCRGVRMLDCLVLPRVD